MAWITVYHPERLPAIERARELLRLGKVRIEVEELVIPKHTMKLQIIEGNLLDLAEEGQFDVIAHGCNCVHTMGAGIARQIKERYPQAFQADLSTLKGKEKLGTYSQAVVEVSGYFIDHNFTVLNLYTQVYPGSGQDVFEYEAFAQSLRKMREEFPNARVGLPLIGCGLAGGDEQKVLNIIETELLNKVAGVAVIRFKPSK